MADNDRWTDEREYRRRGGFDRSYDYGDEDVWRGRDRGPDDRRFHEERERYGRTRTAWPYAGIGEPGYVGGGFRGGQDAEFEHTRFSGGRRPHSREDRSWWDRAEDEVKSWFGDDNAERRRRMDEMRAGAHRGRGPKGYTRSDDRIREDVSDRLADDGWLDASDIEVSVADGEVTLSGFVELRADKRRAEDLADDASGVRHVQNNLRVRSRHEEGTRTMGSESTLTGVTGGRGSTTTQ